MQTLAVAGALCVLVIVLRLTKEIAFSLIVSVVALGIFSSTPVSIYGNAFVVQLIDWSFWRVMITISAIYLLGDTMSKSGDSYRFVDSIRRLFPTPRVSIALLPALIGLLPMPGGAMFSAPMVKSISQTDETIDAEDGVSINYWFRHAMEFFWPLYPAIIIVAGMADVALGTIVALMLPVGLVAIVSAYFLMIRSRPRMKLSKDVLKELLISGWPLFATIVFVMLGASGWIVVSVISFVYVMTKKNRLDILLRSVKYKMLLLLGAVFFFKAFVEEAEIAAGMSSELMLWSIPPVLVIMLLPALMGFMTGITQAAVGLSFPLIMSLQNGLTPLSIAILGYTFAITGVYVSPVHLCVALTTQYFDVSYTCFLKRIMVPLLLSVATGIVIFVILR